MPNFGKNTAIMFHGYNQKPNTKYHVHKFRVQSTGIGPGIQVTSTTKFTINRVLSKQFCLQLSPPPPKIQFLYYFLGSLFPWSAPMMGTKGIFFKFRSPDCWKIHIWHSFWLFCYFFLTLSDFSWKFRVLQRVG